MTSEQLLMIITGKAAYDPAKLKPEENSEVLNAVFSIDKLASDIRSKACKYMKADASNVIPGWKVRPGGYTTSISNVPACAAIVDKDYGISLGEFVAICSVSMTKLQDAVVKKMQTSEDATEDIINGLKTKLASVITTSPRADTVTKSK